MTYLIAEIAQAHEGSVGIAKSMIDMAADAHFDGVKFQAHIANEESTVQEPFRIKGSSQDETRFDYWKRMEFGLDCWEELRDHCRKRSIDFICSPFSVKAAKMMDKLGVSKWKIGSGEVYNTELIDYISGGDIPIIVSTGLSNEPLISELVQKLGRQRVTLLYCVSRYPSKCEETDILRMKDYKEQYNCKVGISDHTGTPFPALAAVSLQADVIEVHITFSRSMYGFDAKASLEPAELCLISAHRDAMHAMLNAQDSDESVKEEMKAIFSRSIGIARDIPAGTMLRREDLRMKKPGTGIPIEMIDSVVGSVTVRDLKSYDLLRRDDLIKGE